VLSTDAARWEGGITLGRYDRYLSGGRTAVGVTRPWIRKAENGTRPFGDLESSLVASEDAAEQTTD